MQEKIDSPRQITVSTSKALVRRRPPGRPRSGRMFAQATISLEVETWHRVDALATALGITRSAVLRKAVEAAVKGLDETA